MAYVNKGMDVVKLMLGSKILGQNKPGQNIPGTEYTGQNISWQNIPDKIYRKEVNGKNIEQYIPTKYSGQNIPDKIDRTKSIPSKIYPVYFRLKYTRI